MKKLRCAIYTRKSSEDGLEQEFNSLDAQREACTAYIASQKHEGWVLLPEHYDDGGLSGGSLERPALQQLLQDIADGRVDQIVVYKIDRLTRSLADFSKIVDTLDAAQASFVSVTQSFNTATSMGRLTLNMLLSFAQFEREVTAERIRDKIAASKRKGLWMGGSVPMGYDPAGRTLTINAPEAAIIEQLYDLYEEHGTVREVKAQAEQLHLRTRRRETSAGKQTGGGLFDRGHIHHILTNPIYAGKIRHRNEVHAGQHEAIIDPDRWDRIQEALQNGATKGRARRATQQQSLLCGKLFDETGDRLTPSHSKTKAGARLRYYVSHRLIKNSGEANKDGWRLPAQELETKVAHLLQQHLNNPMFISNVVQGASAAAVATARTKIKAISTIQDIKPILELLERIDLAPGELCIRINAEELSKLSEQAQEELTENDLTLTTPFQLRKRGVETKLIFAEDPPERDDTLIKNIATAHHWFELIRAGQTLSEIAKAYGTSSRRVQQIIELAFLAPDITNRVLEGTQPLGFTSDWCKRHSLPSDWQEQRALIATL
ncbi:recombinase family protein [Sulfitobacter sp. JBTF-M27]|uniref:Recombinase family protein n=1 Tax=Sulfitobacter sediminilitoris TaxID=2698830 RepID=A0A6P0CCU3_9RHOB|nr:recombinase family protein [Sulfitobacter sediminilitoris]NEK24061.1 recombinase family protein [Sulfitobacter sediminilitoris]